MRKTPETKTKFQLGDLCLNKRTNTIYYIVDIDIAYLAITYLNSINPTGIEYITKHYTEQSINEKKLIHYPVKKE